MTGLQGTVLITGANAGLGSAFVKQFLEGEYPYYGIFTIRGRNPSSSGTVERYVKLTDKPHEIVTLDLTSVQAFVRLQTGSIGKWPRNKSRSYVH